MTHAATRPTAGCPVALISNPLSYTNRRRGPAALRTLEQQVSTAGGHSWQVSDSESLNQAVAQALARGSALLIANGGDGTIHGVVSELLRRQRQDVMVAVLPGGRTNVIAADLNMRGRRATLLRQVLARWTAPRSAVRRPTLEVMAAGEPRRYGFLVNGAGLAQLIESCWQFRARNHRWGLYGGFGTGVWVAGRLCTALLGVRLFSPCAARLYWQLPGAEEQYWSDSLAAFSITTNTHLPLGISPYATAEYSGAAGSEEDTTADTFKATAIAGHARAIGWRIVSGLVGQGRSFSGADGFISGLPQQIRIETQQAMRYHLDGESYPLAAGQSLTIVRGPSLRLYHGATV